MIFRASYLMVKKFIIVKHPCSTTVKFLGISITFSQGCIIMASWETIDIKILIAQSPLLFVGECSRWTEVWTWFTTALRATLDIISDMGMSAGLFGINWGDYVIWVVIFGWLWYNNSSCQSVCSVITKWCIVRDCKLPRQKWRPDYLSKHHKYGELLGPDACYSD